MKRTIFAVVLGWASLAVAGDRELEILVVNMTPDTSVTEASSQCFAAVLRKIRQDDTHVVRLGEAAMLRVSGRSDPRDFLEWPTDALEPLRIRGEERLDAIALIDCRPDEQRLDALVASPARGMARLRLRGIEVDAGRSHWMADRILNHAWIGFSP